jgi:uncharacterized protein
MKKIIEQLEEAVSGMFHSESSGHDIAHLKRVYNLALTIQSKEGGDKLVIGTAAFLHDVHRAMQKEQGHFVSPTDSLPKIKELISTLKLSDEQKDKVLHCVKFHEEYGFSEEGKTVDDIETLIVQDADNLDAIGAIGVGRTFAYGGAHQVPMWLADIPFDREVYAEKIDDPSTVHHFYSKLFKLKDNMHTTTAKQMASSRHKYMEEFLKEFFAEWEGKK